MPLLRPIRKAIDVVIGSGARALDTVTMRKDFRDRAGAHELAAGRLATLELSSVLGKCCTDYSASASAKSA